MPVAKPLFPMQPHLIMYNISVSQMYDIPRVRAAESPMFDPPYQIHGL